MWPRREKVVDAYFATAETPCVAAIVAALVKQVDAAIVGKNIRMPGFAGIPASGTSQSKERLVEGAFKMDTVRVHRATNLLWATIMHPVIYHVHLSFPRLISDKTNSVRFSHQKKSL